MVVSTLNESNFISHDKHCCAYNLFVEYSADFYHYSFRSNPSSQSE